MEIEREVNTYSPSHIHVKPSRSEVCHHRLGIQRPWSQFENPRRIFKILIIQQNHTWTVPQLQANSPSLKKCHLYIRGQVEFEIMILTLHEKHKKYVSYGTPGAQN